jgi:hypothetical protein
MIIYIFLFYQNIIVLSSDFNLFPKKFFLKADSALSQRIGFEILRRNKYFVEIC